MLEQFIVPGASVVVAIIATLGTILVKRLGDNAAKTPTVGEIWARLDKFEVLLRKEQEARRTLREVFLSYVERVQSGGNNQLTPHERRQLSVDDEPTETE